MTERRRRARRRTQEKKRRFLIFLMMAIIVLGGLAFWKYCFAPINIDGLYYPNYIEQDFLDQDGHARTGYELKRPKDIVIHYVSNPGSSATANRNYFNTKGINVSSHFIVGLDGEVIQCIPLDEQSSASNNRNPDTISIEVCHPDSTGAFSEETYRSLVKLTGWLCEEFRMNQSDLLRHYDITGKICPKYYVEHPEAWEQFKEDVKDVL